MRNQQGFTLIELLIVLAILGVLAGIVAVSTGEATDTASTRAMNTEKGIVQTSIDVYNSQNVAVSFEPTIVPRSTPAIIDISETSNSEHPFAVYLKRDTKYAYVWGAGGADLSVSSLSAPDSSGSETATPSPTPKKTKTKTKPGPAITRIPFPTGG